MKETWRAWPLVGAGDLWRVEYAADGHTRDFYPPDSWTPPRIFGKQPLRWAPSIHMPRWASRITLEITDVRVERVREIGHNDVRYEGASEMCAIHPGIYHTCCSGLQPAFARLWDSINAKRGYGWDANPWVWVLTFRATTPEVTP